MKKHLLVIFFFVFYSVYGQQPATPPDQLQNGIKQKEILVKNSLVKNLPFVNIGPTVMSGRVVDIAVNPNNPIEFYVGYASGGVWHTKNNGTSFIPILDNSPTQNVGSLAVDWRNKIIWVGTGEINSSRSSYSGIGLLQSNDNGKTWKNMGLKDSHHISKILINPNNTNEVVVGVIGHLYSKNHQRGVFKTIDGGKTWKKTLFVSDQAGVIEIETVPNNFNIMYASSWDKDRKAWNFRGSGSNSAIYKSTDGGGSWDKISLNNSGFPLGEGVGRIGLAVVNKNTIYAIHDNQFRRENTKDISKSESLTKEDFKKMSTEAFLKVDNKKLNSYLRNNSFQEKYKAENVKQMIRTGSIKPIDLAKYIENSNTLLFDTPVIGAEVYKSVNGGKTWEKTHEGYLDGVYYSYGYYFGKIHVDPNNDDKVYIYGVPILKSKDGGKTFTSISAPNVHVDHHFLWINPKMPGHLINGNDGGVNISYDDGEHWVKCNSPSVGQFYSINVDYEMPYNVYGGLQDNGVWKGPHTHAENSSWHQSGRYPYKFIMGGDGMQIQIDKRNSNIIYTGFQYGNYFRLNLENGEQTYIQPKHELGENPYRFNWQTPILLSNHNQDILYLGGHKLMRSLDKGSSWEAISADLTKGGKLGNVAYGTLTSISESPFKFGLLYVGSDDGLIHVTKNGGDHWEEVSSSLPKDLWVSRIIASTHKKGRVYATLNGYRWDDFTPYIYMSNTYGSTWKNIGKNLPVSSINVIKEDPKNEDILYVGSDNGAYVSLDRGEHWEAFSNGLPNVAIHDLAIQTRENHLLVGTHGRSIYKADISLLQQISYDNTDLILNEIPPISSNPNWGNSGFNSFEIPLEPNIKGTYFSAKAGKSTIVISTLKGKELQKFKQETTKGINTITYDLTISSKGIKTLSKANINFVKSDNNKFYLPKGNYKLSVSINGTTASKTLKIK